MKISRIRTTPLSLPYKETYHAGYGVQDGATTLLFEIETDEGITGIGESMAWCSVEALARIIQDLSHLFIGEPPFDIERLFARARQQSWLSVTPRFANQTFAGLEMALWDIIGKAAGQPVHRLLGGAVQPQVRYFGFLQGETSVELAEDARQAVADGYEVIYFKIGRGEAIDLENVAAVREACGDHRLRLDANEAWDTLTAIRMIRQLAQYNPEFLEQPTPSHSIPALAQVKAAVDIPIAADQCVYTPEEVQQVCRLQAADLIVLGIHETGGLLGFKKAATIAEASGLNICAHGVHETGITTCATNQVMATLPNQDDGNQIMCQLLKEDIVASPDLTPIRGALEVVDGVGLGFELDRDAVGRAAELYRKQGQYEVA